MKGYRVLDRINIVAVFCLIILAVIAYIPAFNGSFVFDDHILIEKNPSIRDMKNIPGFFVSKEARFPIYSIGALKDDVYRPLQTISYTISYSLWGLNAGFLHGENVLIHIMNGIILYFLTLYLFGKRPLSFLASLLFLIHPVQVEAVTYLSGRADGLSLLFFLASFFAFIEAEDSPDKPWIILKPASLLFFAAALFSKEMAATLPFVIILYLIFCKKQEKRFSAKEIFKKTWPYFLILILFLILRTYNLGKVAQIGGRTPILIFLIMLKVFTGYLRLIFFPVGLTFFPEVNTGSVKLSPVYIFYALVAGFFIYLCVATARKNKPLVFLLLSYLVVLLPVSNIIPIKAFMQERFLYFPSIFVLTAISYVLVSFWNRISGRMLRNISLWLIAAVIVAFMAATFNRNLDWKDETTLVVKETARHPEDGRLYFDLGHISLEEGEHGKAREYFETALRKNISPMHRTMSYDRLGNIYKMNNDFGKATEYYLKAVEVTPAYYHSLNSLGDMYFKRQDYGPARHYFEKAVESWPGSADANSNLGTTYIMLGDKAKALKYWRRSLEINPAQPNIEKYISWNE